MSQTKEVPLNGAYYASPPPPPMPLPQQQQVYSRRPWYSCVLGTFAKVMIAVCVCLGIAVLVAWIVLRPNKLKFYVVTADLTQFNLTNNNTLSYNLSLNMVVRNPNKRIGVYYDRLYATASYNGERFGWESLQPFYQGHKNTTTIRPMFRGQSAIIFGGSDLMNRFNAEKNAGAFSIDVKLYARIRFKVGSIKTKRFKPDVECDLWIPLAFNGTSAVKFESRRCDVDF